MLNYASITLARVLCIALLLKMFSKLLIQVIKKVARAAFAKAQPIIDKAAGKGLLHKNKAARIKSRLSARVKAMAA